MIDGIIFLVSCGGIPIVLYAARSRFMARIHARRCRRAFIAHFQELT